MTAHGFAQKSFSLRSRRKHKAWGASPRISSQEIVELVKRATASKIAGFRPLARAPILFIDALTWGLRPRLYAYACYRRLRKSFDFNFLCKATACGAKPDFNEDRLPPG
jgi:hypothetical protein